jgi:hypothetical protein
MKVKVEERREFPPDQWVVVDGRRLCTVCGEENCGWMARSLEGAK